MTKSVLKDENERVEVNIEHWKKIIRHVHAILLIFGEMHTGKKIAWRETKK